VMCKGGEGGRKGGVGTQRVGEVPSLNLRESIPGTKGWIREKQHGFETRHLVVTGIEILKEGVGGRGSCSKKT